MSEKYVEEGTQPPELDPDVWIAAAGEPKKGHVYGFGRSLDTRRVISSCSSSGSHATSAFTTPPPSSSSVLAEIMGFIQQEMSSIETRLSQTFESQLQS